MLPSDSHIKVLTSVHREEHREVLRYKDLEWKITAYTGGILMGIVTLVLNDQLVPPDANDFAKLFWWLVVIAVWAFGTVALIYVHKSLNARRNNQRRIEHLLLLYTPEYRNALQGFTTPAGWMDSDFSTAYGSSGGAKLHTFFEGTGFFFIVCFWIFLTGLEVYAIVLIGRA